MMALSSLRRCAGCGRHMEDVQRGRPARRSGLLTSALYPDCRDYLRTTYGDDPMDPGWTPDRPENLAAVLNALVPLPILCDTGERAFHEDLFRMVLAELKTERSRVRLYLLLDDRAHPSLWHAERLHYVEEMIRGR